MAEFRKHMSHYFDMCATEDVHLTRNGEIVAILLGPDAAYYQNLNSLLGCLQEGDAGESYDKMIGDEILRRCGYSQA